MDVLDKNNIKITLDDRGVCPECGADWDAGDIFERLKEMRAHGREFYANKTDEEIENIARQYGWAPGSPKHFSRLIGVELPHGHPEHYDGVSFWQCPDCKTQWKRAILYS